MNEQTKEALVSTANEVMEWIRAAGELVADQAPLLVEDVLAWGLWGNVAVALTCLVVAVTGAALVWMGLRETRKPMVETHYPMESFGWVVGSASLVVGFIGTSVFALKALKVHVAPRLYLLEQLSDLVR